MQIIVFTGFCDTHYDILGQLIGGENGVTFLSERYIDIDTINFAKFQLVLVSPHSKVVENIRKGFNGPILTSSRSDVGADVGPGTSLEQLEKMVAEFSATPERPP